MPLGNIIYRNLGYIVIRQTGFKRIPVSLSQPDTSQLHLHALRALNESVIPLQEETGHMLAGARGSGKILAAS